MQASKQGILFGEFFLRLFQGLFVSLLVSFLGVAAVSLYVFFSGYVFAENVLRLFFVALMLGSVFIAAAMCSYLMKARGLILGIIIGGIYAGVILFASAYFVVPVMGMPIWIKYAACAAAGGLGGVIGVNISDEDN